MNFRTFLIGFAALFVATNAAIFSVSGLSMLFAGAAVSIIVMAGSLEFAKLVAASFLYYYWDKLNFLMRSYFIVAVTVLIIITSLGIYGFLTAAYQKTSDELQFVDAQIEVAEMRKDRFQSQIDVSAEQQTSLNTTIQNLSEGLSSGTTVQYVDAESGQLVTTTSTAARRTLETQLNNAVEQRDRLSSNIIALSDSISAIDFSIIEIRRGSEVAGEVGPLRFMAESFNLEMSTVVNIFALLIVFVFDPLAVTMIIAFNMALKFNEEKKILDKVDSGTYEVYGDTQPDEQTEVDEEELQTKEPETLESIFTDDEPIEIEKVEDIESEWEPIFQNPKDDTVRTEKTEENSTKVEDIDADLTKVTSKRGVDIDGDGRIDGYDTDGDGLINEFHPESSSRWREVKNKLPYYARKGFDWSNRSNWIHNQNAVNYYLTYVKGKYPDNFDSKVY